MSSREGVPALLGRLVVSAKFPEGDYSESSTMSLLYTLFYYLTHPGDILALIVYWLSGAANLKKHKVILKNEDADWAWCYEKLVATSRSFSALILQIHEDVREPLCLFYIILRGLDTIEDDMKPSIEEKKKHLKEFYTRLTVPGWNLHGFGAKHECDLLENFDKVISCFMKLKPHFKEVITDICHQMGDGMAEFLDRQIVTLEDWDLYAHYVAGIVGHGLSRLWITSGLGDFPKVAKDTETLNDIPSAEVLRLSNSVGVFLQKINMIRDIVEDVSEDPPRIFWPRQAWGKYTDKIQDMIPSNNKNQKNHFNQEKSMACLNELVLNAMQHIPDCLDYLKRYESKVPDTSVFRFVGVATMMCMATLELCYDNSEVFKTSVKIPKGEALRIMQQTDNYQTFVNMMLQYVDRMIHKAEYISFQFRDFDCSEKMISQMLDLKKRLNRDILEIKIIS